MINKTTRMAAAEYRRLGSNVHKPRKYRNKPVVEDGIRFDSMAERNRWFDLQCLEHSGHIRDLQRQTPFTLHAGIKYKADFTYIDAATGKKIAEDVKGFVTREFRIKKRLFEADYPDIELRVVN